MDSLIREIIDSTTEIEEIERHFVSERHHCPRAAMRDLCRMRGLIIVNRKRCSALFAHSASSDDRILAQIHANLNRETLWIGCRSVARLEETAEQIRLQARECFFARPVRLMGEKPCVK